MLLTAYGIPEEVNVSKTRLMKNTIEELFFFKFWEKKDRFEIFVNRFNDRAYLSTKNYQFIQKIIFIFLEHINNKFFSK